VHITIFETDEDTHLKLILKDLANRWYTHNN